MPIVARSGSGGLPSDPVDWNQLKREILASLSPIEEYRELGVRFVPNKPRSIKGWVDCYAYDRKDDVESAAVNVLSPGWVYHDRGGEGTTLNFFDFALRHGKWGTWIDVVRHYADKAGVPIGKVERNARGGILEEVYHYDEAPGRTRYVVHRIRLPNGKKTFRQYPLRDGELVKVQGCMEGVVPLPYRLPELLETAEDDPVLAVEGEKDVDSAWALGIAATSSHQGSDSTDQTWPRFVHLLPRRAYYVIPDNAPDGRKHAAKVAAYLHPVASRVHWLTLPGVPAKGDLSDWLDLGGTLDELGQLMARAPLWTPETAVAVEGTSLPKAEGPKVATAAEDDEEAIDPADVVTVCLDDVVATEVSWLWQDRVPLKKVTLFAGEAKLGKSYLTMDLAARVSVGAPVPCGGGECMPMGSVIILSAEDDLDDTIKPRLIAAGADCSKIHSLATIRLSNGKLGPFNLGYVPHLEVAVRRFPDTKLVIIDPVTHYLGSKVDDHKATHLREALDPLKQLASRLGVAIVIVTHLNKGTGTKALARVLGSGAYTALARSNWLVFRDPKDPSRRLMLSGGTNLVEDPPGLAYTIANRSVVWEDELIPMTADEALLAESRERSEQQAAGKTSKSQEAARWLHEILDGGMKIPSAEIEKIAKEKGFARSALWKAKDDIIGFKACKGHGEFAGQWYWSIPPEKRLIPEASGPPGDSDTSNASNASYASREQDPPEAPWPY
jgi:putative DNA primase/helicase